MFICNCYIIYLLCKDFNILQINLRTFFTRHKHTCALPEVGRINTQFLQLGHIMEPSFACSISRMAVSEVDSGVSFMPHLIQEQLK